MLKKEIIGENILKLRRKLGYSQEQLAKLARCSQKQISRYEHGEVKNISYGLLKSIASVLDVTIEYLEDEKNV